MTTVIAIANQKGGVGKTTTAINVCAELSLMNFRTLLIDFDPQGSATSGLGVEIQESEKDIYDMFFGGTSLSSIIRQSPMKNLWVAPSSPDLVGLEIEIGKRPGRELVLSSEIRSLSSKFDFILVDCPPSSGLLTLNALGAAKYVLIPLQAEYYALEGLSALINTISFVNSTFNRDLSILGVAITMFDARTNLSSQVEAEAVAHFGKAVFSSRIPRSIKLSEAPSHGMPICRYDPGSSGARAYHILSEEIVSRCGHNLGVASNG